MRKISKAIAMLTVCVITTTFSSCVFKGKREPETPKAELVLQYIQEKNTDGIYDLLCERLQNQPGIKQEIENTFDIFDGKIVSYEVGKIGGAGGVYIDGKVKEHKGHSCEQIKTSSEKVYQLVVNYYDENDFETDLVGIFFISIVENHSDGTPYTILYEMGEIDKL